MKAEKIIRFRFSAQTFPQLVQQAEQLGVLLRRQQPGDEFISLVEGVHGLFVEQGPQSEPSA